MIVIVNYGMGNLRSVEKALLHLGHQAEITSDPARVKEAERVIVPGVGAFGAAMERIGSPATPGSLGEAVMRVVESGRPFLGICLGMQLLLSASEERGSFAGLGLLPGRVVGFPTGTPEMGDLKVPHIGWSALRFPRQSPLFSGLQEGTMVYFVHSYFACPEESGAVAAVTDHGVEFCSALATRNIYATQFHPEKSGAAGLRILDNFARL